MANFGWDFSANKKRNRKIDNNRSLVLEHDRVFATGMPSIPFSRRFALVPSHSLSPFVYVFIRWALTGRIDQPVDYRIESYLRHSQMPEPKTIPFFIEITVIPMLIHENLNEIKFNENFTGNHRGDGLWWGNSQLAKHTCEGSTLIRVAWAVVVASAGHWFEIHHFQNISIFTVIQTLIAARAIPLKCQTILHKTAVMLVQRANPIRIMILRLFCTIHFWFCNRSRISIIPPIQSLAAVQMVN